MPKNKIIEIRLELDEESDAALLERLTSAGDKAQYVQELIKQDILRAGMPPPKYRVCAICGTEFEARTCAKYCAKCRESGEITRRYYQENKNKYAEWAREYREEHRDEYNKYAREYYQDHLDTVRATARKSAAKRRGPQKSREKSGVRWASRSEYNRAYYAANKERIAAQRKAARDAKKVAQAKAADIEGENGKGGA